MDRPKSLPPMGISLALLIALTPAHAIADEWWQGTFIPDNLDSGLATADPDRPADCHNGADRVVEYTAENVFPWETSCKIEMQTNISRMQAVILDMNCTYPDGPGGYQKRELLMRLGEGPNIMRYAPMEQMIRCEWPD